MNGETHDLPRGSDRKQLVRELLTPRSTILL
jgi:hypothetical protein